MRETKVQNSSGFNNNAKLLSITSALVTRFNSQLSTVHYFNQFQEVLQDYHSTERK